ncbi:MAG TPA: Lrp/AsnC family transcriptional regulator [Dongiaceae bacterium]|jgi:DNA-binding Lrp family transcriptional regulator|nr:Lrp/AsnC family transcriptional regulator [Dongiaceae bacterium]
MARKEPKIDDRDRDILALLEVNSRMPISKIAIRLGVARSTVHRRLKVLRQYRAIESFTIRKRPEMKNPGVGAYFFVYLTGPFCSRVAQALSHIEEIRRSQSLGGEIDMLLYVQASSIEELSRVREAVERIAGVHKVTTGIVLNNRFDR